MYCEALLDGLSEALALDLNEGSIVCILYRHQITTGKLNGTLILFPSPSLWSQVSFTTVVKACVDSLWSFLYKMNHREALVPKIKIKLKPEVGTTASIHQPKHTNFTALTPRNLATWRRLQGIVFPVTLLTIQLGHALTTTFLPRFVYSSKRGGMECECECECDSKVCLVPGRIIYLYHCLRPFFLHVFVLVSCCSALRQWIYIHMITASSQKRTTSLSHYL